MHGGGARQVKAQGVARAQEAQVRALAATLGVKREVDPKTAILEQIHWSAGHVEFYRQHVEMLAPEALIAGTRGETRTVQIGFQAGESSTIETGPDVHVWLKLYNDERKFLTDLCAQAVRLGLEEARVQLEMRQGARIAEAFRWLHMRMAARLGSAGAADELRDEFVTALRTLTSGAPFPAIMAPVQ
jgi:hypothetical protein